MATRRRIGILVRAPRLQTTRRARFVSIRNSRRVPFVSFFRFVFTPTTDELATDASQTVYREGFMSAESFAVSPFVSRRRRAFSASFFFVLCAIFASIAFAASSASARAQDDDLFGDLGADAAAAPEAAPAPAAPEGGADAGDAENGGGEAAGGENAPKNDNYLVWMFRSLGWFFAIVFAVMSLTTVALAVMNFLALRRSEIVPNELTTKFGELLDENKFQDAYRLAKEDESLLGRVLATGLARTPSGYEKAAQAMQDVQQESTQKLEQRLGYLAMIGNIAPMVGLFGTVVGMIESFQAIASGGAAPSPQKLAEGIATALFTTEIGLAIALPSLVIFEVLKNRLARFILEISIVSDNFMSRFSSVDSTK